LLAAGYADEIVARRMGVSVRTCRTHIARLMRTLGASSRTHLGALLAHSGIVGVSYRVASRGRADDK
jgi:DNA-binding NarL/FixJ family response regulator